MDHLIAKTTTKSGNTVQAMYAYDEQYGDYVGFIRLNDNNLYGEPFKNKHDAKRHAMNWFAVVDSPVIN